ncbi:MAG: HAMP domain-containing histidine kinase [Chitinophagaceae bacterium]|nr:HAMP domain-containing histidine kinase [Chitinophagaceae bacterium]
METLEKKATEEIKGDTLKQLVKKLVATYQPIAVNQNSFFINEVPEHLLLHADKQVLSTLLGSLLYLTARCGKNTCIKISAKRYHDVLLLHVVDTCTENSYSILTELQHLKILAEKIGGFLDITSRRNKQTTISFSFMNRKENSLNTNESSIINELNKQDAEFVKYLKAS